MSLYNTRYTLVVYLAKEGNDMGIKIKNGIMCGLTAIALIAATFASSGVVKAEELTEGQKQFYQNQAAVQQYYINKNQEESHEDEKEQKDYRSGIMHVQNYELNIGDSIGVSATDGHYGSSDPNVAYVDGNGKVVAKNDGSATIMTYLKDGTPYNKVYITVRKRGGNNNNNNNKNNNVVYYPVYNPYYAPYYALPVYATTPTVNPTWNAVANNMIAATPQKGTVNLSSGGPLFFDASFANMLKLRPDVTVNVTYGYNGHIFLLTIPRGYNLTSKLNPAGYVDFVTLSNVIDGKIRCSLVY